MTALANANRRRVGVLSLSAFCLTTTCLTGVTNPQTVIHYVTSVGSASPESGQAARPWQSVEAAARALPAGGGILSIAPGTYRETFVLRSPARLTASGKVLIGDAATGVVAATTFRIFTWNTHLFGDIVLRNLRWQDYQRAEEIGAYFAGRFSELDLVSLSEIWDEDLFTGGDGAAGIRPQSGYPNWMIFTDIKGGLTSCGLVLAPRVLHSGLALMTRHAISDLRRVHYDECEGSCPLLAESPDCLASKGFMAATVVKDGFPIRIYNTHTQAGYGSDYIRARRAQIEQLARDIASFRAGNPSHVAMVMGDMNVIGDTSEEYSFLRDQFGALNGHDAARNTANVSIYQNPALGHTLTSSNNLARHFDEVPHDERLDYVWYFPSLDGKVIVQPIYVERLLLTGATRHEGDLTSPELSDHYPLEASFRLLRTL